MSQSPSTVPNRQSSAVPEPSHKTSSPVNVGETERWLSLIGGSTLALYSLRRSLGGLLLLVAGGALICRGLTGHCSLYQTMGVSSADTETSDDTV